MIEKMKKLTFLVTNGEYDKFIEDIRDLGIVHIEELQHGATSDELQSHLALADRFKQAITALSNHYSKPEKTYTPKPADASRGMEILCLIEQKLAEEVSTLHALDDTKKDIQALEPWGEINWNDIKRLEEKGMKMSFFTCPNKMFKGEWIDKYHCIPVNTEGKREWFVAFNAEENEITAQPLQLPEKPLSVYKEQEKTLSDQLDAIHEELFRIYGEELPSLLAAQLQTENDIDLSKVHLSHESIADDAVRLLIGWVLDEKKEGIISYLDKNKIFYEIDNPAYEDEVPVKIKNDKFSELFEPILRMYSLPNYHDIDPLPLLSPFFMLFFGLCMGDAGYGILIAAVSLAIVFTKPALKSFGYLGTLLGVMTIICGGITGSFFGINLAEVDWEWIKPIQPYFVNDSMKEHFFGYSPMMVIAVIIGLVQVLIGMTMAGSKAVKNYGFIYGVGKFSWVVALLSAVALYGLPMFGVVIPMAMQYVLYALIAVSAVGIYFLNNPAAYKKNKIVAPLSNLGGGLWATYGMSTGLLGDLLSYIRLFALGLTGGVLGSVFNTLAMDMSPDIPVVHEIVMLIILLLGHGINFGLCMISSFVHPMRLTFVEYFKNAEFDGGGKEYKPFKLKVKN